MSINFNSLYSEYNSKCQPFTNCITCAILIIDKGTTVKQLCS
nr:MAG TPA: hypothetical protein [Caudoviricetes sp.]